MITEDRLRSLLAEAADAMEPPAAGPARIVAAAGQAHSGAARPPRLLALAGRARPRRLAVVSAALVVVVAAGLAVSSGGGGGAETQRVAGPASLPVGSALPATPAQEQVGQPAAQVPAGHAFASRQPGPAGPPAAAPAASSAQVAAGAAGGPGESGLARIAKTGALQLVVAKGGMEEATRAVGSAATGAGGYVAESATSEARGRPSAVLTIRVPAGRFDSVTDELRRIGRVRRASSASRDVTGESTDTEARLRTLNGTRDALLGVLAGTDNVGDVLAVQSQLSTVQSELEQLQARQRVIDGQVALASLTVSLQEPGTAPSPGARPGRSALERALDGFTGAWSSLLAHSGTALAVVVMLAVGALVVVVLARWGRRAYVRWMP